MDNLDKFIINEVRYIYIQELNKAIFSTGDHINSWYKYKHDNGENYYQKILFRDDLINRYVFFTNIGASILRPDTQIYFNKFEKICPNFFFYSLRNENDDNTLSKSLVVNCSADECENIILPIINYLDKNHLESISDINDDTESIKKLMDATKISSEICKYIIKNIANSNNLYTNKIGQSGSINHVDR